MKDKHEPEIKASLDDLKGIMETQKGVAEVSF
jgi:hypothetical protein